MKDYASMSDFEINSAVHNALLNEPYSMVFMGSDRIEWTSKGGEKIITDKVPYTKNGVHDYCNNPADAWPIIQENRIMLNPYCADELWKCEIPCNDDGFMKTLAVAYDKNPLRAAMIVFLMMQEGEK